MTSTPEIVLDEFVTLQTSPPNNTLLSPPGIWQPSPSERHLLVGDDITATITGGQLVIDFTASGSRGSILYISVINGPFFDISGLATIFLEGITLSNPAASVNVSLRLNDSDGTTIDVIRNISGTAPQDIVWNLQTEFANPNLDLESINIIRFEFNLVGSTLVTLTAQRINSTLICVAKDTMILMADGIERSVQSIQRGDFVAGDLSGNTQFKVSRVLHTKVS